jgi:hypothetical protein
VSNAPAFISDRARGEPGYTAPAWRVYALETPCPLFARARFKLCAAVAPARAQPGSAQKKVITHDVYDTWKSIQGTKISADGTWIAYALTPQEGDGELVVRNLKTNAEIRAPRGRDPLITSDNKFVVYAIAPLKKDVDQARKAKRKPDDMPKNGVGIVNFATGQATTVAEHVKASGFLMTRRRSSCI